MKVGNIIIKIVADYSVIEAKDLVKLTLHWPLRDRTVLKQNPMKIGKIKKS